jgi:DNA-binding CsgD family transcriptional regulator
MAATALQVDAAIVSDARERRDLSAVAAARERSAAILADAERAVDRSGVDLTVGSRAAADAALATARAFRARIDGRDDPATWAEVADRWTALEDRYQVARARWHQAEAALTSTNDARAGRAAARGPLLEACSLARELGAGPLLRELGELAGRALISLPAAEPPEPPEPHAARNVPVEAGFALTPGEWGTGFEAAASDGNGDGRRSAGTDRPGGTSDLVRGFVGEPAPRRADPFGLSPREKEVLFFIAQGRTNREIGERLFISQKTVGVHVGNILSKLDVSGRVEAATVAIRLGLTENADRRTT